MLASEQSKAVAAVREAEQSSTKIYMYEKQTENAEKSAAIKDKKIDELNETVDRLRKQQIETEKAHLRQLDAVKKAKDEGVDEKSQSLQIKLIAKEGELERIETRLMEMQLKMDEMRQEQQDAQMIA